MKEWTRQQLQFLVEVDKMKQVFRRTVLTDQSRRENDAEHSWHFALMAMVMAEYADPAVDLNHVLRMALVHDLVEVYAGDTFAYDVEGNKDKEAREIAAADKLFGMLPAHQRGVFRGLWDEFEAMETKDSQYAAAIDRLQPFLNNSVTDGYTWREGKVHHQQVLDRMDMVRVAIPELWPFVEEVVADAMEKGYILP